MRGGTLRGQEGESPRSELGTPLLKDERRRGMEAIRAIQPGHIGRWHGQRTLVPKDVSEAARREPFVRLGHG